MVNRQCGHNQVENTEFEMCDIALLYLWDLVNQDKHWDPEDIQIRVGGKVEEGS